MLRPGIEFQEDLALFDIVSYGRRGLDRRLSPGQVSHVSRTVRRTPEVMVKVSGGGAIVGAVKAHFRYIGRKDFTIETDDGDQFSGKIAATKLVKDWELDLDAAEARSSYNGRPGRKPGKLVHNIILSMPAGSPPQKVLAASRDFARETFALQHRYALVLHTNEPHPHTHLVVRAMSEQGKRLNIRKATLREWRREFARHLRGHGVAANATERPLRGEPRVDKRDGIYRAHERGASTHVRERAETVARELRNGVLRIEPGKSKLIETRKEVHRGWNAVSEILELQGQAELAANVRRFVHEMASPMTEKEQIALQLREGARRTHVVKPPTIMR
jgi:hypothetical protein